MQVDLEYHQEMIQKMNDLQIQNDYLKNELKLLQDETFIDK